jgi:hypothetical protein
MLSTQMGLLGVARADTAVGVSPETFLLLLVQILVETIAVQTLHQLASSVLSSLPLELPTAARQLLLR